MSDLRLYNTLTHSKDEFEPADEKTVKMYCCGPTVYNYAHIGNLRTYLFEDLLRRVLENLMDWEVKHIVNITDVGHMTSDGDGGEDKMAKAAKREGRSPWEIARFYEDAFVNDLKRLNILHPTKFMRATEHVNQMIALIQRLEKNGYAYRTNEGIYFDTAKDADYGALASLTFTGQREGARAEVNIDPDKRHPSDFILWFTNKPNHIMKWESPWGVGYPGWHIECSAMAMDALGDTLDIHCGGIDHIPVHNTNEIAQSESATGHQFARFWIHGAFLNIKGASGPSHTKMAKSGDNFVTVDRLIERGYDPLGYRYLTFTAHYRSELAFTWDSLDAATKALNRIRTLVANGEERCELDEEELEVAESRVAEAFLDDLNAPKALALLHEYGSAHLWLLFDVILQVNVAKNLLETESEPPDTIADMVIKREQFREEKKFAEADAIRDELASVGYSLRDGVENTAILQK